MNNQQLDTFINESYHAIAGRKPSDAEFNLHRKGYDKEGDVWLLKMVQGFGKNNDIAWKKGAGDPALKAKADKYDQARAGFDQVKKALS